MDLNEKLSLLRNQVVSLAGKICREFPNSQTVEGMICKEYPDTLAVERRCDLNKDNILGDVLLKLLDIINQVIMAVKEEEPQEWWDIKVKCNSQELLSIQEQIAFLELRCEISKSKSKE